MTAERRYTPCSLCRGDGCPACDGAGFHVAGPAWFRTPAPPKPAPVAAPAGGWLLVVARDGTAATGAGDDRWTFARWALALSADGSRVARRYRNGGPVGVIKPVSGKRPPEWMARAARFVASIGGIPEDRAPEVAEWFRTHRAGCPTFLHFPH